MPLGHKGFQKGVPAWSKGKKLTKKHKERIAKAHTGKKKRPLSKEARAHLSEIRKGRKFSIQHRKNLSKALRGSKSSFWRGGVTHKNKLIRCSLEYKLWRTAVFERDNYTCIWCGVKGGRLQADHIKPFSLYPELRFALDNGRTLCEDCHKTTDTYQNKMWSWKQ